MTDLTLMVLRFGFLILLWLFVFAIVYALRSDLFGAPVRKMRSGQESTSSDPRATAPLPPFVPAPAMAPSPAHPAPVIPATTDALPSAGFPAAPATGPAKSLVITAGPGAGRELPLDDPSITIGRSPDSTLVILDEYTSTYHARLTKHGDDWTLTDLDSTNGTKVNGARVTDTVSVRLFEPVTIGKTTFELRP